MTDQPRRFGDLVRDARQALALTQDALADRLGVTQPLVSMWEQGTAYPATRIVLPLAEVLGVDVGELLRLIPTERPAKAVAAS